MSDKSWPLQAAVATVRTEKLSLCALGRIRRLW